MSTDTEIKPEEEVMPETETPMMTSPWAEVYDSPVHGRGMVATVDIPEEATIIEYVGELVDKDESNRRGEELAEQAKLTGGAAVYLFVVNDESRYRRQRRAQHRAPDQPLLRPELRSADR